MSWQGYANGACIGCGSPNCFCKLLGLCVRQLMSSAVKNAKKRGHSEPTITTSWIRSQPLVCPYFGVRLVWSNKPRDLWQPSLDRVDNDHTYTPENTRLTSLAWNNFRNVSTVEQALDALHKIREQGKAA